MTYSPDYDTTIRTVQTTNRVRTVHTDYIDFDFPFEGDRADDCKQMLRTCAENVGRVSATTDLGWPRFGWKRVIRVGMVSQWPYWSPRPCVLVDGTLGSEWWDGMTLTGVQMR